MFFKCFLVVWFLIILVLFFDLIVFLCDLMLCVFVFFGFFNGGFVWSEFRDFFFFIGFNLVIFGVGLLRGGDGILMFFFVVMGFIGFFVGFVVFLVEIFLVFLINVLFVWVIELSLLKLLFIFGIFDIVCDLMFFEVNLVGWFLFLWYFFEMMELCIGGMRWWEFGDFFCGSVCVLLFDVCL